MNAPDRRLDERVLLLLSSEKDARTSRDLIAEAGFAGLACKDVDELRREIRAGAAVVVLTEEAIIADGAHQLAGALGEQPDWSDLPLIVLTRGGAESPRVALIREETGNAIFLERPVRFKTLVSVIRSTFNARMRQYAIRDNIEERRLAEERLRRSEQALREADRRKDEFLAMLAHELRNPLAAIRNAVELVRLFGPEEHSEWAMDVVGRQANQLGRLIEDLLDVSRISEGKIRLQKEVFELRPVLQAAVEAVGPLVRDLGHELTVSLDDGPLTLLADPTRVGQMLVNLLSNAAKYSERGGQITLDARAEGAEVVIRVKDTGVGIPEAMLPRIFGLYTQVPGSLDRSRGGLGIGLTLVKSLAELQGGEIRARSDGEGKGSEFILRLPASAAPPPAASDPNPEPEVTSRRRPRVLVVDDNQDTARGLARLLRLSGHDVKTAHDGPGAIELARADRPDAILLDIGLPGMDGYQVATRLREEVCGKEALLIAVSGHGQEDDRRRSREAGFDHHLVKPVDYKSLVALLNLPL